MKRVKFICASVLMLAASAVYADPAFIISNGACAMADGDGGSFYSTDVKQVQSNSNNGNINLKCYATGVANSTGKAVRYNFDTTWGLTCGAFNLALTTERWQEVVDTEGNAVLTCHFRVSD